MTNKLQELYALERLSGGDTCVHRLHPAAKLLATAVFLLAVVSFDRYAFGRLIPYIFYPTLLMALSETPYAMLLQRFLLALPFCLFAGFGNILFDRTTAFAVGGVAVSYGVVSCFTILFKAYLCVMSIFILVSVTPLSALTNAMRRFRMPYLFVMLFEMTYRYIGVLFEEAHSMYIAYTLRGAGAKGIKMGDMGSFVGQLLLRSFDRADRVYSAMKCRGYALHSLPQTGRRWTANDVLFLTVTCGLCFTLRFTDLNALFIGFLGGLG